MEGLVLAAKLSIPVDYLLLWWEKKWINFVRVMPISNFVAFCIDKPIVRGIVFYKHISSSMVRRYDFYH